MLYEGNLYFCREAGTSNQFVDSIYLKFPHFERVSPKSRFDELIVWQVTNFIRMIVSL